MKSLIFILFLIPFFGVSQTKIIVRSAQTNEFLQNISVFNGGSFIGKTDINGEFSVSKEVNQITLKSTNYKEETVDLERDELTVFLYQFSVDLDEAIFLSEDPLARALIKKVIQNQKKNNPENLESFQYKTYSKFWADVENKDSISYIWFPKNKEDSTHNRNRKLLDESLLFLGERGMDHKYDKKYGRKNVVKANRISGIKTPLYEFVAAQPISHTFDSQKFSFFFTNYVNPVSKTGLYTYFYRISDTIQLDAQNTIVVSFKPKSKTKKNNKIRGEIFIEPESYAVIKFTAEGTGKSISELEMDWVRFQNYWFPKEQRFLFEASNWDYPEEYDSIRADGTIIIDTVMKKQPVWAHLVNTFKEFKSPVEFNAKEFKGYENEVATDAFDAWNTNIESYRNIPLTKIERDTYLKIDSLAKKEGVEKGLKLLRIVTRGGLYEAGKFDVDLTRILGYNDYEGFRLGIPLQTNYKFNEQFSINGYLAYGFKDKAFKYGGGIDWFVNKPYSGKFFANYKNDVAPSGRYQLLLQNNFAKFRDGSLENIYNRQFYTFEKVSFGYQQDLLKNVTTNFSLNYETQQTQFTYAYKNFPTDSELSTTYASLAIRWSPKNKFMRTPYGKVTIASGYPYFYFNFNQGVNLLNADYTPFKFDTRIYHVVRSLIGRTRIQFNGGFVLGDSPITYLFEGYGNARSGTSIGGRFAVAAGNAFETMQPGEFYSDRFASIQLKHQIAGFRFFKKEVYPTFIYRSLIGEMENQENHQGFFDFTVPARVYQEVGVEFNNLFFKALGIGTYYRFGAYSLGDFNQNFSWKLTLNLPSF